MKLLHYTYRKLSFFLLLLMTLWGVLFYYTILDEVMDEADDTLQNNAHLLVKYALDNPDVFQTGEQLISHYKFTPISKEAGMNYRDHFYNDMTYIEIEDEYEPVRVFQTAFCMPDGQYYELAVMISTIEYEDMLEKILGYLTALFLLLLLLITVGVRLVLKGVYRPLTRLMEWLHAIQPGKKIIPIETPMQIREFRELERAVVMMGNRSHQAYEEQKQFIENASHELQTPLAIACGKVELLAENENLNEQQMKELDALYTTLNRAVRLNKSLLLLTRIENGQYSEVEKMDIDEVIDGLLPDLMDIYHHKQIKLLRNVSKTPFLVSSNHTLIQILISNLLKNALLHNVDGGRLIIETTDSSLEIMNSGYSPLNKERLFRRFAGNPNTKKESVGLGLAIAHSIAEISGLELNYSWENNMHRFRIVKK